MIITPQVVDVVDAWLETKHVSQWLNWDLRDPEERRGAAEWFSVQLGELAKYSSDYGVRKAAKIAAEAEALAERDRRESFNQIAPERPLHEPPYLKQSAQ